MVEVWAGGVQNFSTRLSSEGGVRQVWGVQFEVLDCTYYVFTYIKAVLLKMTKEKVCFSEKVSQPTRVARSSH